MPNLYSVEMFLLLVSNVNLIQQLKCIPINVNLIQQLKGILILQCCLTYTWLLPESILLNFLITIKMAQKICTAVIQLLVIGLQKYIRHDYKTTAENDRILIEMTAWCVGRILQPNIAVPIIWDNVIIELMRMLFLGFFIQTINPRHYIKILLIKNELFIDNNIT